jgi:hypothetical protein
MRPLVSADAPTVSRLGDQRTQVHFRFGSPISRDLVAVQPSGGLAATLIERVFGVFSSTVEFVQASASPQRVERVDDRWTEERAARPPHFGDRVTQTPRPLVWSFYRERIERVSDGDDARGERDLLSRQPVRVTRAIPALVMPASHARSSENLAKAQSAARHVGQDQRKLVATQAAQRARGSRRAWRTPRPQLAAPHRRIGDQMSR